MNPKQKPHISDSPFKCKMREDDRCKASTNTCPYEEFKGSCCLFCKKKWTCPMTCMKVLSYLAYERSNPAKFTPQEKKTIKNIEYKGDLKNIGNPSERKKELEQNKGTI